MKSNVCKIKNGTKDLATILNESERVAEYNGLTHKQTLQLRLICEEVDGMLPNVISDFEGDIWIEFEDGVCSVNVSIEIPELDIDEKEALINIAKNKKNAATVGIVGKIRNAIENILLNKDALDAFNASTSTFRFGDGFGSVDFGYSWSLEKYRNAVEKDRQNDEWDELEKSVITFVADDIIVGVKGRRANITVVKKFE